MHLQDAGVSSFTQQGQRFTCLLFFHCWEKRKTNNWRLGFFFIFFCNRKKLNVELNNPMSLDMFLAADLIFHSKPKSSHAASTLFFFLFLCRKTEILWHEMLLYTTEVISGPALWPTAVTPESSVGYNLEWKVPPQSQMLLLYRARRWEA